MIRQRKKTIPLSDIKVTKDFADTLPNPRKIIEKTIDYCNGRKPDLIRVDRKNHLFDGYITYLILLQTGEVNAKCLVEWEEKPKKEKNVNKNGGEKHED